MRHRFRWVFCQLESLRNCIRPGDVRRTINSFPKTLDETYDRILLSIDSLYHQEAIAALQWLTFSKRQRTIKELTDAIIIDPKAKPPFDKENRLPNPLDITKILTSLVVTATESGPPMLNWFGQNKTIEKIRLSHFSVEEYLTSDRLGPLKCQNSPLSGLHPIELLPRAAFYISKATLTSKTDCF